MLLAALLLAGATSASEVATPFAVFKSACTEGSVRLPPASYVEMAYDRLPSSARAMLAWILLEGQPFSGGARPPASAQVPNRILQLRDGSYLILPNPGATGRYATVCAVVLPGEHFKLASESGIGLPMFSRPPGASFTLPYMTVIMGGYELMAAAQNGWTIMSARPVGAAVPASGG